MTGKDETFRYPELSAIRLVSDDCSPEVLLVFTNRISEKQEKGVGRQVLKVEKTMLASGKGSSGETPQRAAVDNRHHMRQKQIRVSYPSYESLNPEEDACD